MRDRLRRQRRRPLPLAGRSGERESARLGQGALGRRHGRARSRARVQRDSHRTPGGLQLEGSHPGIRVSRRLALQLLAGRQSRPRHLAPHHAGRIFEGRAGLGNRARCRRPGRDRQRELGVEGCELPRARAPALPGLTLARRRGRHDGAGIRYGHQGLCRRRLRAARGQAAAGLEGREHAVGGHQLRRGLAHRFGLPPLRQGMETRDATRGCGDGLRGLGGRRLRRGLFQPHARGPLRPGLRDARVLPRQSLPAAGRAPRQARPAN